MQFTESNPYVLRLLEALAGQGPALALMKGRGWGGVYNAIEPTEIEMLIRCYLYSAKLPRTRTGRVRHSKSDCTSVSQICAELFLAWMAQIPPTETRLPA